MTEKEFFAVERDAALDEKYHGTKIEDLFREKIKKEYPGAKIMDAHIHYAFGCQLDMSWQKRKFEKHVSKTAPIVPAVPIEEFKIWEIDSNKTGDFEKELSDTCYEEECENCHGQGHLECPGCHGAGEEQCPECHGHEPHKCTSCHGTGAIRTKCYRCDGTGRIKCDECYGQGSKRCSACGGEGSRHGITCSNCRGTGRVTCPSCNGAASFVCTSCGGRGGETNTCGECHGTGELHNCRRCQDKGVVTCRTCNGDKKLHCEKCGDVGHHTWIYYLIQSESTKTLRSVSVAHNWAGECRKRYKAITDGTDYDKMEFAVAGSGTLHFGSDDIPESLRLRVAKMWQAMYWGKEFKEYDDDPLRDDQSKDKTSEKNSGKKSEKKHNEKYDWKCRVTEGKLLVTKIDTHAYVNIKWNGVTSSLFFEPESKKIVSGRSVIEEKKRVAAKTKRRNGVLKMFYPPALMALAAYLIGVYKGIWQQSHITNCLSTLSEHYCTMSLWMNEHLQWVYNFWDWPIVFGIFAIAIGAPFFKAMNRGFCSVIIYWMAKASGVVLLGELIFCSRTSWYLAVAVAAVAIFIHQCFCKAMSEDKTDITGCSIFSFLNTAVVVWAMAYCVIKELP